MASVRVTSSVCQPVQGSRLDVIVRRHSYGDISSITTYRVAAALVLSHLDSPQPTLGLTQDLSVVEWSNPHGSHYTTYQPCTILTLPFCVYFIEPEWSNQQFLACHITSQLVRYALLTLTCSSSHAAIFVLKVKELSRTQHHAFGTICPYRCMQLTPRTSSRNNLKLFYLNVHFLFKRHCYTYNLTPDFISLRQ